MSRLFLGRDVFSAAYDRLHAVYAAGHRVVVSFSSGKDSTICLELAIMAARDTGRLPVEVVVVDEEILFPGSYEFCERVAQRPEVALRHLVLCQPGSNIFNREAPYWWVMDPLLDPEEWVRKPPSYAELPEDKTLYLKINPTRYPVEHAKPGEAWDPSPNAKQRLVSVVGIRTQESRNRLMGIAASGGHMTKSDSVGTHACRPIYDWTDDDVWKFIAELKCDYNTAYNTMYAMGVPKKNLRIGPIAMNAGCVRLLQMSYRAWPQWFDRVAKRLPGIRTGAMFGKRTCSPFRRYGETWEACFRRECFGESTPAWIRDRSKIVMENVLHQHARHSTAPFPERVNCRTCGPIGSWKSLANTMWDGNPHGFKTSAIPEIEPEFFRPGAGTWKQGHTIGKADK